MLNQIKRAETKISNVEDALVFLEKETLAKKAKVSILFISPAYDRTQLASKIPEILGDHVFGCTTAGEIGPSGYNDDSIVLVSFHGDEFEYNALFLDDLKKMGDAEIQKTEEAVEESAKARAALGESANTFAFMMIDGLSGREEIVVARISSKLGDIPLVGGSAGDKLNFGHTWVWNGVYFSENSALLLLISTTRQFEVFKAQHFVESDKKIVVTSSNP